MKMKDRIKKQSNKGFTLVEVLVAILILSIIVVPLLSAFVVSANTNAKARRTLRATTLAQNVLEELKAYSIETSAAQYNGTGSGNAVVSAADVSYETVLHIDDVHKALTLDADGVIQGRTAGRYDFVLKGVAQGSAKFDVEVLVRKPEVKDPAQLNGVGELDMVNIVSMNRSDCAYYAQQPSEHQMIGAEYARLRRNFAGIADIGAGEFEDIITRTITIDVDVVAGNNEKVKVTYTYQIPTGYVEEALRTYTQYSTIFDNYASGEALQSVYLYYYPLYGVTTRDTFVINNPNDLDVDIYLIKMKDDEYNVFNHANYKPYVYLNEDEARDDHTSNAKICTNIIHSNIYGYYNGAGTGLRVTDLGNEETMQNLYDVTVRVYKHNADAFGTSGGEVVIDFDDKDRLATFTGTILDKAD